MALVFFFYLLGGLFLEFANAYPTKDFRVFCVVMRDVYAREVDVWQEECHYYDIHQDKVTFLDRTYPMTYKGYNHKAYGFHFRHMLELVYKYNPFEYALYLESDTNLCVPLSIYEALANAYEPYLLLSGMGASGWMFSKRWILDFQRILDNCGAWCYCIDCLAAMQGRWVSTRKVLVSHIHGTTKVGLHKNKKHLPMCMEIKYYEGMNHFDRFDHNKCKEHDISPCYGHSNQNILRETLPMPIHVE